jgi:hypothetical protein
MPIYTTQNCHWVQKQDTQDKEEGPKVLPQKKFIAGWKHIFPPSFISSHVFYPHLIVDLVTLKTSKKSWSKKFCFLNGCYLLTLFRVTILVGNF